MYIQSFQNAAASKITVTGTATNIFDLVNTAGSTTAENAGFSSRCNAIIIQPEDGDIRVLFNNQTPTATNGFKITSGSIATFCNVPLKSLKLIRTSGSVVCSVQIGISDMSESSSITGTGAGGAAVTSVIPGTGATNLGKAEDAVHASGDTGVFMLNVRKDTAVSTAGTDGDYAGDISNSTGHKWVAEGFAPQAEDNANGVLGVVAKPLAVSTYAPTRFQNLGANATLNVKAATGNVFAIKCHNVVGSDRYIQLHNTATTPSGGGVPVWTALVPPFTEVSFGTDYFTQAGINLATGIAFAVSTTEATYTAATATDHVTHINFI